MSIDTATRAAPGGHPVPGQLRRELRLLMRSRMAVAALLLLGLLSTAASLNGARLMQEQQARIAQAKDLQAESAALVAARYGPSQDAGNIAYHRYVLAWDPPAPLGFAAVGQRDLAPWLLRLRALGLQAQLYEGEHVNPALVLAGRFDFAFVLVYLAPLILIALLHDMFSAEREAGRLRLLRVLPQAGSGLWQRRAGLRVALALILLSAPALLTAAASGVNLAAIGLLALVCALYLGFWAGLCIGLGAARGNSGIHAARLVGVWLLLCLVLPSLGQAALQRALPADSGMDLMLEQRNQVHAGWDRPKADTFERFFIDHPEWSTTAPVETRFHWKWYYALQHAGDMAVRDAAERYRNTVAAREYAARQLGWLLPNVATQTALHRLADSDLQAHLEFLDRASALHGELRRQLYPYVFEERPWTPADETQVPVYSNVEPRPAVPLSALVMLTLWAGLGLLAARRAIHWVAH